MDMFVDIDFFEYQEYINSGWDDYGMLVMGLEEEFDVYVELFKVGENLFIVMEEDVLKK